MSQSEGYLYEPLERDDPRRRKKTLLGGMLDPGDLTMGDEPAPRRLAYSDPIAAAATQNVQLGGSPPPPRSRYATEMQEIQGDRDFDWNPRSEFGQRMIAAEYGQAYKRVNDQDSTKAESARILNQSRLAGIEDKTATRAARLANIEARTKAVIDKINMSKELLPHQKQLLINRAKLAGEQQAALSEQRPERLAGLEADTDYKRTRADFADEKGLDELDKLEATVEGTRARTRETTARTEKIKREGDAALRLLEARVTNAQNEPAIRQFQMELQAKLADLRDDTLEVSERNALAREVEVMLKTAKRLSGGSWFTGAPDERGAMEKAAATKLAGAPKDLSGVGSLKAPTLKSAAASGGATPPAALGTVTAKSAVPAPDTGGPGEQPGTDVKVPVKDSAKPRLMAKYQAAAGGDQAAIKWLSDRKLWPRSQ